MLWDAIGGSQANSHPNFVVIAGNYGWTLLQLGRREEARDLLLAAYRRAGSLFGADNWKTAFWQARYGECLRRADRTDEARPLLIEAHQILLKNFGPEDRRVRVVGDFLAELRPSRKPQNSSLP